jgi:hypothetical protein
VNFAGQASPPLGTFLQVESGTIHTCGIRTDGSAVCWGRNDEGQATSPPGTFVQVSAGAFHSCGVRTGGTITCWGANNFGQSTPSSGSFVDVQAGERHTCALRLDGTTTCWGSNDSGQVSAPPDNFLEITAGYNHNCGLRLDGGILCWGSDFYGQSNPPAGDFAAPKPAAAIAQLMASLDEFGLEGGELESIAAPLQGAVSRLTDANATNDRSVCGQLQAAASEVEARIASGRMDESTGIDFISSIYRIRTQAGCSN